MLVAFSGTVLPDTEKHTESSLNNVPESQTVERFGSGEWRVLVGAEKYQTGFDQQPLYAMYVDKTLSGLAAVQTLSRLNRTYDGKYGTFVLDFRNDTEDIRESFSQWYTTTVAQPTDPNLLYDTPNLLYDTPGMRSTRSVCWGRRKSSAPSGPPHKGPDMVIAGFR